MLHSLTLVLAAAGSTHDLQEVLTHAEAAAGAEAWQALEHGLALDGDALYSGVDCAFDLAFAPGGEFRFAVDGPLANTSTWDGEQAWSRDGLGPARPLVLEELESSLIPQWVHSGHWTRAGLEIELLEPRSDDVVELTLALPDSPQGARLTLDAATWLPRELWREDQGLESTVRFLDHREVAGVTLAHRVEFEQAGVVGFVEIEGAAPAGPPDGERFDLEGVRARDTRFLEGVDAAVEVRRVATGHLLVHPRVDGADLGWFILDTGAGRLCIDPQAADTLELPEFGSVPAVGVAGAVVTSYRGASAFRLGPLELSDPVFVELDLAFLEPHFGVPIAGICGHDVFARSVFELDLEAPGAALHDPAAYELARGEWSPLVVEGGLPCIPCRFEGDREGLFRIDTGDPGTVTFHGPAVAALALLEGRDVRAGVAGGVGGTSATKIGELDWFEIAGRRFDRVEATFSLAREGAHAEDHVVGTLGSELLRAYEVVLDYGSGRIALAPRAE